MRIAKRDFKKLSKFVQQLEDFWESIRKSVKSGQIHDYKYLFYNRETKQFHCASSRILNPLSTEYGRDRMELFASYQYLGYYPSNTQQRFNNQRPSHWVLSYHNKIVDLAYRWNWEVYAPVKPKQPDELFGSEHIAPPPIIHFDKDRWGNVWLDAVAKRVVSGEMTPEDVIHRIERWMDRAFARYIDLTKEGQAL